MFKWSIAYFIFTTFLGITYTSDPTTLTNSSITTKEQAVAALAEIQPIEALPLVLFDRIYYKDSKEETHALRVPEDVSQVITLNGKMIQGTKFHSSTSETQIFFCPKENSQEACLAPKEFKNEERLQCAQEPTPIVRRFTITGQCGFGQPGIRYSVHYEICPNPEGYKYEETDVILYEFCYDKEKQKILFTIHSIKSPKLISSKLLYREQNISYPFTVNSEFETANYEMIRNAIDSKSNSSIASKNPMYEVQKLVPSEDMALALWQKTLYQFFNAELQHKKLLPLWNMINGLIAKDAVRKYDQKVDYFVRTGVFDITTTSEDDTQIYNMWIKVIQAKLKSNLLPSEAVVILMNNFIDSVNNDSERSKLKEMKLKIESYCKENLCLNTLTKQFTDVEGRVRCCPLTTDIAVLFGIPLPHVYKPLPGLKIPGITLDFEPN